MTIIKKTCLYSGYVLVLLSAILFPNHYQIIDFPSSSIMMVIGAILLTIIRIIDPLNCTDPSRTIRLRIHQLVGTLAFYAASYFMYYNDRRWIIATLIGALIDLVLVYRLPQNK